MGSISPYREAAPNSINGDHPHSTGGTYHIRESPMGTKRPIKVIFIGMGAAGINFARSVIQETQNIDLTIYEKNGDIGGTWLENRYPGCACDIPSVCYQFSWQRKPDWSRYYVGSREIYEYFKDVTVTNKLERFTKFNHKIVGAEWLESVSKWRITVMKNNDPKQVFDDYADFFLNGGGQLNAWKWPDITGLTRFQGPRVHSANWDDDLKLDGKRVLVIGVGSSAVQIVPNIVEKVDRLHVVARSPTWITAGFAPKYAGPGGANFVYSEETRQKFRDDPKLYLQYCKAIESELNVRFRMVINNSPEAIEARKFSTSQMEQKLARKPELIDKLMPKDFGVGCRRPTPGNGFLEALCEEKTTVWTESINEITETGFVTADGKHHEVDVIICATGFDTTFRPRFPLIVNGRNTQDDFTTRDVVGYLGVNMPEIPNYFMFSAPYGPLGHGSFLPMVEAFTGYILNILNKVQVEDIRKIQVKRSVAEEFTRHADTYLQRTAWIGPCSSWFKAGQVGRKPVIWPGSRIHYLTVLKAPRYEDYDIFYLTENRFNYLGDGFEVREYDGRDLTWYYGLLDGEDKQPATFPPPMYIH
ncbi:putative MoxY [Aspergillus ambiguus]|uniref:flavin-containing monooxygenase n=1 Tax=Aspergillus ambiguus TaxID=176160 RepID=UPI003CCDB940